MAKNNTLANKIHAWMSGRFKRRGQNEFTTSDICVAWAKVSAAERAHALNVLIKRGDLKSKVRRTGERGRPATIYRLVYLWEDEE